MLLKEEKIYLKMSFCHDLKQRKINISKNYKLVTSWSWYINNSVYILLLLINVYYWNFVNMHYEKQRNNNEIKYHTKIIYNS